jgi:hypothetical protein
MIDNIYDTTLEILKEKIKNSGEDAEFYMMKNLVELLGEHEWNSWIQHRLEYTVEYCKESGTDEEEWFGCFFHDFHKSIRQTDVYNIDMSKKLGELKEDQLEYWKQYAEKHSYYLDSKVVGKNEYQRTIYTLYYRHAGGHLDLLFYHLICATNKVEKVMHVLWDMHIKGFETYHKYFWSDDFLEFNKTKKKDETL